MKEAKRLASLFLCLALLLSGCGGPSGEDPANADASPAAGESADPMGPVEASTAPANPLRIALCTSPYSIDDHARNAECNKGVQSFIQARGFVDSFTPLQETSGNPDVAVQAFHELAPSYDVMIFVGPVFSQITSLAQDYPDKRFILMDAPLTDATGAEMVLNNAVSIQFADQECGFLAGMAAAMETQSGYISLINDVPSLSNSRYCAGFRSGVDYANGNFSANAVILEHPSYTMTDANGVTLGSNFTGSNNDPAPAAALANSLADEGCDVIFMAAGLSGEGAYEAVRQRQGVKLIASEADRSLYDSDAPAVLASVTKDYAGTLSRQLSAIDDGSFQGGNLTLRAADNAIGFAAAPDTIQESTRKALSDALPLIKDGTIVPRSGS